MNPKDKDYDAEILKLIEKREQESRAFKKILEHINKEKAQKSTKKNQ